MKAIERLAAKRRIPRKGRVSTYLRIMFTEASQPP
jgi:hypothetical protein